MSRLGLSIVQCSLHRSSLKRSSVNVGGKYLRRNRRRVGFFVDNRRDVGDDGSRRRTTHTGGPAAGLLVGARRPGDAQLGNDAGGNDVVHAGRASEALGWGRRRRVDGRDGDE